MAGGLLLVTAATVDGGDLRVAAFACDATPPKGHPLCGGWIQPLTAVDDPLLAKGVVLSDGRTRYALCAVDWCLLQTGAYDAFRESLAKALEIPVAQVALHTVHQHNAPIADANAQRLLDGLPGAPAHLDLEFLREVTERVGVAAAGARARLQPFTHVGYGSNRVERFASNRRVRLADGRISPRFSSSKDPVMRAAPEGLVDPWLRTVTFFADDRPLVRLHYYATHPQSYYGDGRATADTVGLAREQLEKEEGVPQIYFTGCAGDITAGKYNDGSPQARRELTERIFVAMKGAAASTQRAAATELGWKTAPVRLALRSEPEWQAETSRKLLTDTNATLGARLNAALNLAWIARVQKQPEIEISRLDLGPVSLLGLPGEAFLEFQLYAQALSPARFVAVAAYGEGGPGYICTDASLTEGGYEPADARVGAPSEFRLKAAIAELLSPIAGRLSEPPAYADKRHLLAYRDKAGFEHPVRDAEEWNRRRSDILASMQMVMGPLPRPATKEPLELRVEEETRGEGFTRQKVTYTSETGDRVPAYLLLPDARKERGPAVLCLHQTTPVGKAEPAGVAGKASLQYGKELAQRGFVVLCPDYPNFGDYVYDPYAHGYVSATMKGVWNHVRGVDLLASLPTVDPERIGVVGHSLGGHNALFLAAFDERIRAVVTSCGFNSFWAYADGNLANWSHRGYMPLIASRYGSDPNRMPFDFTEVLGAVAPRAALICAPLRDDNFPVTGVMDCLTAARPVYALLGAEANLSGRHPDVAHEFPEAERRFAYDWLEQQLK